MGLARRYSTQLSGSDAGARSCDRRIGDRYGDYLIQIGDRSGVGGPTAVYRIEIEPAHDAVHTLLSSTAFDWEECIRTSGLAIPQGNRWTVNVSLPQGQGSRYRGELELVAHG